MQWKDNDELFFQELRSGHAWQALPALFLNLHGLKVEMPSLSIRQSIEESDKWLNSVDLYVNGFPIEIKSRNETFTSVASFPYDSVLIDTVLGYDAKLTKPLAYIMVSRPTGAMLVLKGNTNKGWWIETKTDRIRDIQEKFYVCKAKFLQTPDVLVSWLKKNQVI